jgi:HEAT repeat protein
MSEQEMKEVGLVTLMEMLSDADGMTRLKARDALVKMGSRAVPDLVLALRVSSSDQVRWEAAKALGSIEDIEAVPALVEALGDENHDVAWLVGEALRSYKEKAWVPLLKLLMEDKAGSAVLCQRLHHVFQGQKAEGYNDLLSELVKALESGTARESASVGAFKMLKRMKAL